MIVITGDTRSKDIVKLLQSIGWGRMLINKRFIPYKSEPWGFYNGVINRQELQESMHLLNYQVQIV